MKERIGITLIIILHILPSENYCIAFGGDYGRISKIFKLQTRFIAKEFDKSMNLRSENPSSSCVDSSSRVNLESDSRDENSN